MPRPINEVSKDIIKIEPEVVATLHAISPTEPFWQTKDHQTVRLYQGDVIKVLRRLPEQSVHCIVTSPPYWNLRDYETGTWEGGDPKCKHVEKKNTNGVTMSPLFHPTGETFQNRPPLTYKGECKQCGARRIDRQLGSEKLHDCGQVGDPLLALREDLSNEERNWVVEELKRRGIL